MKKWSVVIFLVVIVSFISIQTSFAQCSICTKTAGQMGEKQGLGLNSGIVYLMMAPFAIVGYIGYRYWKSEGK
jgi:hypothetical protein